MRAGLSQAQEQALMRSVPDMMPPPAVAPTTKEIPYDYVAKFKLQGIPATRVQDVINISTEGTFVAVAIGYSFIPAQHTTSALIAVEPTPLTAAPVNQSATSTTLVRIVAETIAKKLTFPTASNEREIKQQAVDQLAAFFESSWCVLTNCLLVRLCGIDFKYSIVDSGTGRELQNQAIHNIAGLGESTGKRPFRPLAKPMLFLPRSTIRIEVEEISQGEIYTGAELFIVLHGYKMLGYGTGLS
jgi:hypothetical protein